MSKKQILIVEDEGLVAKDLQAMLRRLGYHVPATVGTGELALQTALLNRPDLILMDIQLRGAMDGVQAAAAITAEFDVPILYLTANSDEATFQRAKGTDPFGFLVKPFEERSLVAGIEMALYKHQTEKRTREREQWLATTLSSIADAVITTDANGRVSFINTAAERLSGWSREQALAALYTEVFQLPQESACDLLAAARRGSSEGSRPTRIQSTLTRRDGTVTAIEYSVAPLVDTARDAVLGSVIVFTDVSERKKLEEHLRQAQKMDAIGKLAGGIAHDFNNAITAIIGYAEMILGETGEADPHYRNAKQIVRAAGHSARLTHQLLAFSRKQVLQPRSLNLGHELHEIEGMVRRLIGENISLAIHLEPALWNTLADPGQVHQVILNMAINARDAMGGGGRLSLDVRNVTVTLADAAQIPDGRAGEYVLLTISDTGSGMSPQVLKHIFEPFFTTKEPGKGTGLGLATCYGIIKQTAGMIDVHSEVGVGTTFSIYLPRALAVEESKAQSETGTAPGGQETILVVEDEEILRELAIQVLENLGYRVIPAGDGVEAMQLLEQDADRCIRLVLTDLVMPRMGGRELVSWIHETIGDMPVLFMSGYTDDSIIRNAIEGAEVRYLQKPFTPKMLAQKIREIFDEVAPAECCAESRVA